MQYYWNSITLNNKYYKQWGYEEYLDWYRFEDVLKADYVITDANLRKLRKFNVAASRAIVGYNYNGKPIFKFFIRKKDIYKLNDNTNATTLNQQAQKL